MTDQSNDFSPAPGKGRADRKADIRARIMDALLALLTDGVDINHDRVAGRAGIARRTVYRYFPDHSALMQPVWDCVTALTGSGVTFPESESSMLSSMGDIYRGFDTIAPLATVVRSTAQGRAARVAQKERRNAAYIAATADAVRALPDEDRILATATIQALHTTPWLEMRDNWSLDGEQIARACGWAMRVLLKDLRERGGRPLDEGPAGASTAGQPVSGGH